MTYPPQGPEERQGLGDPGRHMPEIQPPAAAPPPVTPPPAHPLDATPPPAPKPPLGPWIGLGTMGLVAVIGVVVALLVFDTGGPSDPGGEAGGGGGNAGVECEPASSDPEGEKLSADKFYDDKTWTGTDFMTDEKVSAKQLGTWDHNDCCDIGLASAQEVLNEADCSYAIESAYETDDAHMGISQLVLVFADTGSSLEASDLDFTSFRFQPDSGVYDDSREIYGYSQPSGKYLILTIGAIDDANDDVIDSSTAALESFHTDFAEALPW